MPRKRKHDDLQDYDAKRDRSITPEPGNARAAADFGPLTFVVQKHAARALHYDLRLELDGTYKSWAVPKGPSLDAGEKRLAVQVEDHPLEYGTFEGVIPGGEYGAGEDIVWDNGTYGPDEGGVLTFADRELATKRLRDELEAGKLSFTLRGRKLRGSWTLVKTSQDERSWLLIKHRDETSTELVDVLADEASVLSGVTVDDLKAGALLPPASGLLLPNPAEALKAKRGTAPGTARTQQALRPMLATSEVAEALERRSFAGDDWLFEPKLDGVRALIHIQRHVLDGEARLVSRNGNDLTSGYPAVAAALAALPVDSAILDGELVAPTAKGIPSFERLQQRMNLVDAGQIEQADAEIPVVFFAFDLLHIDGVDLRGSPLWQRKEHLVRVLRPSSFVQVLAPVSTLGGATPKRVFDSLVTQGFEGVVAKRRESAYVSGKRSPQWLKFKAVHSDEFVVGGFTPGNGARASTFGALLVGQFEPDGSLRYTGRVGSGFSDALLDVVRNKLDGLLAAENPFAVEPPDAKVTTYLRPEMVVELKYAEVTGGGQLRAPVFLRVRADKPATSVVVGRSAAKSDSAMGATDGGAGESSLLGQLEDAGGEATLLVGESEVAVTNLDKEMWPAHGDGPPVLKRDLLRYYAEMAPFLLPHLANRPLTLTRFPNGLLGKSFYQKHWSQKRPSFVETVSIYSEEAGTDQDYLLCNNLPTLLWLGQLADIALHVSLARTVAGLDAADLSNGFRGSKAAVEASLLNYPDFLLFDLDPFIAEKGSGVVEKNALTRAGFEKTTAAALWLKELLDGAGIRSFVKTSGASGIHVFVPIMRNLRYDVVRAVCSTIAGAVVQAHAKDVTTVFDRDARRGKVYIDINQNGRIKSLASIYSPRANPGAPVSMPLRWDEVAEADPLAFNVWTAADRVRANGDLWAGILAEKQDLRSLAGADLG